VSIAHLLSLDAIFFFGNSFMQFNFHIEATALRRFFAVALVWLLFLIVIYVDASTFVIRVTNFAYTFS